jgi:hypothetical protein
MLDRNPRLKLAHLLKTKATKCQPQHPLLEQKPWVSSQQRL